MPINLPREIIAEINKENCINRKEISSKCSFEIRIKPPLTKSLNCILKFNDPSNEIIFSNIKRSIKAQEDTKCPLFALDIYEGNKPKRLFARCGENLYPINKTYFNVSLVYVSYYNQDLFDNKTNLKMNLSLSDKKFCDEPLAAGPWNKLHLIWIIAAISLIILSIIGIVVVIMRCKPRRCFKKKSHEESTWNQTDQKPFPLLPESGEDREDSRRNQSDSESNLIVDDRNSQGCEESTDNPHESEFKQMKCVEGGCEESTDNPHESEFKQIKCVEGGRGESTGNQTDQNIIPPLPESRRNQSDSESNLIVDDRNSQGCEESIRNQIEPKSTSPLLECGRDRHQATISYGKNRFKEVWDIFENLPTKAWEKPKEKVREKSFQAKTAC